MPHTPNSPDNTQLVDAWLKLWNGDYSQAGHLIATDFRVHAAMLDGGDGRPVNGPLNGPQGLVGWISQTRAVIPDLRFSIQVGPTGDGDHIAVRWSAEGTYAGGFPGATAPAGTPVAFTGTDLLRVQNGMFVEYWVNSDTQVLLRQLQVTAG